MPDEVQAGSSYVVGKVGMFSRLSGHVGKVVVALGDASTSFFSSSNGVVDVRTEDGELIKDVDITQLL